MLSKNAPQNEAANSQDASGKNPKGHRAGDSEGPSSKCKEFKSMVASNWKWSWVFNGILLLILVLFIVVLEFDLIYFRTLGYNCNDPRLSYLYKGDTIRYAYLVIVIVFIPFFVIIVVEYFVNTRNIAYRGSWKKRILVHTFHFYGYYGLGLMFLMVVIQLSKSIITEPRPHFFDTCKPDKMNCTGYITKYRCTSKVFPKSVVRDSNKSFPSGHSALGWFYTVFMSWYLQRRVPPIDYLVVPFFQCVFVAWGCLCSLTRITDRRHHWWDVLVGFILGVLFAIFTAKVLVKDFEVNNDKSMSVTIKVPPKEKPEKETRGSWFKKADRSHGKTEGGQASDDKELREVK